jgi:hypothetical protein
MGLKDQYTAELYTGRTDTVWVFVRKLEEQQA